MWDESEGTYAVEDGKLNMSGINVGTGINEWSQAMLMKELNTDYLGNVTIGTDGKWNVSKNILGSKGEYLGVEQTKKTMPSSTLNTEAQNMIENAIWHTGTNGSDEYGSTPSGKPSDFYNWERSNNTGKICTSGVFCTDNVARTTTWTGKVALMYPSDYGYATSGSDLIDRSTCLNEDMGYNDTYIDNHWFGNNNSSDTYKKLDCSKNSWLLTNIPSDTLIWTMTPRAREEFSNKIFSISPSGMVEDDYAIWNHFVYPAVYLKSSVKITSGDGSQSSPYTLG